MVVKKTWKHDLSVMHRAMSTWIHKNPEILTLKDVDFHFLYRVLPEKPNDNLNVKNITYSLGLLIKESPYSKTEGIFLWWWYAQYFSAMSCAWVTAAMLSPWPMESNQSNS